jgi:hypothetical protein
VAAEHPDFGCSSFSPIVRLVLVRAEGGATTDGVAPRLVVSSVAERTSPKPSPEP